MKYAGSCQNKPKSFSCIWGEVSKKAAAKVVRKAYELYFGCNA
jgi:hypothetical protein